MYVTHNYLKFIRARKDNVDKHRGMSRTGFKLGDVVDQGERVTKVYVDGVASYGHEITGTDYFKVPPGTTEVQFYYSDFSSPPPIIKAKIREVYL